MKFKDINSKKIKVQILDENDSRFKNNDFYVEISLNKKFLDLLFKDVYISCQPKLYYSLSKTETSVLKYVVDGLTNREISVRLKIAESTVKVHLRNIYQKLSVQDRTSAVVMALNKNLIN